MRFYAPSKIQSVKDIAGFTKMKYRKDGQNSLEELKAKDLKSVLEEKERKHFLKASKEDFLGTYDDLILDVTRTEATYMQLKPLDFQITRFPALIFYFFIYSLSPSLCL